MFRDWHEDQCSKERRKDFTDWLEDWGKFGTDSSTADVNSSFESTVLFRDGETGSWKSWTLTTLTQKWVAGDVSNQGVMLYATNENTDGKDLRFHASESDSTSLRPKLEVTYTEDPLATVFFLKDHLGSIRAVVDDTAGVVGYTDYDPWGYLLAGRVLETAWSGGQNVGQNKFTGKEWDDDYDLNWFHFGARPYDPEIGRWMSVDPLAKLYPSLSPYSYAFNSPLTLLDAHGEYVVSIRNRGGGQFEVQANRFSITAAKILSYASYSGAGAATLATTKLIRQDPALGSALGDFAWLGATRLFSLGLKQAGRAVDKNWRDRAGSRVLNMLDRRNRFGAYAAQLEFSEFAPLGLDQVTFEVASKLSIDDTRLGSLGPTESIFAMNPVFVERFGGGLEGAEVARVRLDIYLEAITVTLSDIAVANRFDLGTSEGRSALHTYLRENIEAFQSALQAEVNRNAGIRFRSDRRLIDY